MQWRLVLRLTKSCLFDKTLRANLKKHAQQKGDLKLNIQVRLVKDWGCRNGQTCKRDLQRWEVHRIGARWRHWHQRSIDAPSTFKQLWTKIRRFPVLMQLSNFSSCFKFSQKDPRKPQTAPGFKSERKQVAQQKKTIKNLNTNWTLQTLAI